MKFAAIADVHGNGVALEAVLSDIATLGITEVVNLGDHVSGPLEPRRTADLLIERCMPSIQGDQDRRLVELDLSGPDASRRSDYRQLNRKHFDWMASLPPTMVFRDEVFMCHGSPTNDTVYWLDRVAPDGSIQANYIEDVEEEASGIEQSLILCGHTHIPRVVRLRDGRLVVNPGSVGLPAYDGQKPVYHKVQAGTPDACYAILERGSSGWSATFRFVPYDHISMAKMARENGMPGKRMHNLLFKRLGTFWQLWVRDDDSALPVRFNATYASEPGRPQYALEFRSWSFEGKLADMAKKYAVPSSLEGWKKVDFVNPIRMR